MQQGFAEALRKVGRRPRAKAQPPFGDEEEPLVRWAGRCDVICVNEDDP